MTAKPIPNGFHTVTPYIMVKGVTEVINFLTRTFDAQETERLDAPDGSIGHAEIKIGDSILMLSEERGDWQPMPASLYVYVDDTDATYQRGLEAGGVSVMEPADQFYGDRNAGVKDSAGNCWWIATHIEDVAPEELRRRHDERYMQQQAHA